MNTHTKFGKEVRKMLIDLDSGITALSKHVECSNSHLSNMLKHGVPEEIYHRILAFATTKGFDIGILTDAYEADLTALTFDLTGMPDHKRAILLGVHRTYNSWSDKSLRIMAEILSEEL